MSRYDPVHENRLRYLRSVGVAGYVPAAPVRERLRSLHDDRGITWDVLADRMGLNAQTLKDQYHGRRSDGSPVHHCERRTERLVLGARFTPADGTWFPVFGVRRRLQSLAALGYTMPWMGERLGKDYRDLHRVVAGKRAGRFVRAGFARAVDRLWKEQSLVDPVSVGVLPVAASQARTRARKNGYAPAHCWDVDTIDDPDALPEWTGYCGTPEGRNIHERSGVPVCPRCENQPREKYVENFDGEKLRRIRRRKGFTLESLAEKTGGAISPSTILMWERGLQRPRPHGKLQVILAPLDVTIEDLVTDE